MSLRTVMQVGPAKANELFAKLFDTSEARSKPERNFLPS